MKKVLACLLAVLMVAAFSVTAFAANPSVEQETTVQATTDSGEEVDVTVTPVASAEDVKKDKTLSADQKTAAVSALETAEAAVEAAESGDSTMIEQIAATVGTTDEEVAALKKELLTATNGQDAKLGGAQVIKTDAANSTVAFDNVPVNFLGVWFFPLDGGKPVFLKLSKDGTITYPGAGLAYNVYAQEEEAPAV
ncbi:MAG: hypothetical protein K6C08_01430 [Oscillospiraceae bacterium]|nr:hypothetical protein [Oscillospiraceae bacterium]